MLMVNILILFYKKSTYKLLTCETILNKVLFYIYLSSIRTTNSRIIRDCHTVTIVHFLYFQPIFFRCETLGREIYSKKVGIETLSPEKYFLSHFFFHFSYVLDILSCQLQFCQVILMRVLLFSCAISSD